MNEQQDYLSLKFGKLKEWNLHSDKAIELLDVYLKYVIPNEDIDIEKEGVITLNIDIDVEKRMICDIIDACNSHEIYLDFHEEFVSKEEAKQYILEYEHTYQ